MVQESLQVLPHQYRYESYEIVKNRCMIARVKLNILDVLRSHPVASIRSLVDR